MKRKNVRASPRRSIRAFFGICLATLALASPPNTSAAVPVRFGGATNFAVGNSPRWIAAGDFNRDGNLDIATANWGSNSVSILFGEGTGAFTNRTDYTTVVGPSGLAVGPFDSDNNLDIIVLGSGGVGNALLGDGTGGFIVTSVTNQFPSSIVTSGDFNGDGNLDLATLGISVVFGRGDGSFTTNAYYSGYYVLAAGDLTGDGKPDLLTGDSSYGINVLSNKGNGTFAAPIRYLGSTGNSVALADFNGDGKLDVATVNYYAVSATIRLNVGNGLLGVATNYSLGSCCANSIEAGDFNGDGNMDLVGDSGTRLLLGNGDGSFTPGIRLAIPSGSGPHSLVIGDFNRDGKPDIAFIVSPGSVGVLLNETPPALEIMPVSGHVQITWSSLLGAGYSLEFSTNLFSPSSWQPFPYPPVVIGEKTGVADFIGANKFYRLKK